MPTVKEIVKEYLEKNNYDGLYCEFCGCRNDDLMSCSDYSCMDCQPGCAWTCDDCADYDNCDYDHIGICTGENPNHA